MLLLIDNYDSFTYNLVQAFGALGTAVTVRRNDEVALDDIERMQPDHIVISPGPGRPEAAGESRAIIRRFGPRVPILGVCLGHQAIATVYGASVARLSVPVHGKSSTVAHDGRGLFQGLTPSLEVARYHSLVVDEAAWPAELEITARTTDDNQIMALRHRHWPTYGVQFHPESILTPGGAQMLETFLSFARHD